MIHSNEIAEEDYNRIVECLNVKRYLGIRNRTLKPRISPLLRQVQPTTMLRRPTISPWLSLLVFAQISAPATDIYPQLLRHRCHRRKDPLFSVNAISRRLHVLPPKPSTTPSRQSLVHVTEFISSRKIREDHLSPFVLKGFNFS